VELGGRSSGFVFSAPASSDGAVLRVLSSSVDPATGGASATMKALRRGRSVITASKDLPCRNSTPPCMAPTQLFRVTIVVTA
jgi:hypothetical protein